MRQRGIVLSSLVLLAFINSSCSMVWYNPDRPFSSKPVKCEKTWVPVALDVAGLTFGAANAYYYHTELIKNKNSEDYTKLFLLITSLYLISTYTGTVQTLSCEDGKPL